MLYVFYKKFRSLIAGRGLSKYRFLLNLEYFIKRILLRPKGFIEVRGYKYFLDPKQSISRDDFDDNVEVRLVEDFLKPGDVFVDVGANIGFFSVIASRKVGNEGKVFSFEPNLKGYNLLLKNLKENGGGMLLLATWLFPIKSEVQ